MYGTNYVPDKDESYPPTDLAQKQQSSGKCRTKAVKRALQSQEEVREKRAQKLEVTEKRLTDSCFFQLLNARSHSVWKIELRLLVWQEKLAVAEVKRLNSLDERRMKATAMLQRTQEVQYHLLLVQYVAKHMV